MNSVPLKSKPLWKGGPMGIIFLMDKIKLIFKEFSVLFHVILGTKIQKRASALFSHCP